MTREELEESVKKALRFEFENAKEHRAVEIYKTSIKLGFNEQAREMASDIEAEFNTKLD